MVKKSTVSLFKEIYCIPVCVLSYILYPCLYVVISTVSLFVFCHIYCIPVCVLSYLLYPCLCFVISSIRIKGDILGKGVIRQS